MRIDAALWAKRAGVLGTAATLWAILSGCSAVQSGEFHAEGKTMGGTYHLKSDRPLPTKEIQQLLDRLDVALMSTYAPDSELSQLNRTPAITPFPLSTEVFEALSIALEIGRETQGAFDITVGPLVNAWGFGPPGRSLIPAPETIAAARERVGFEKLTLGVDTQTIVKSRGDIYCDLSGIAPGYASDAVARLLETKGYVDYLIEIGGEVKARGHNALGQPWQIGIERPVSGEHKVQNIIALSNESCATSGDYRNFFFADGRRYSHIINPATGEPINHALASVTVVHPCCARADAYATALMVLGPDAGQAFALAHQLSAYFIVRELDGTFSETMTPGFRALIVPTAAPS